ncbi:MAG: hypothetical protein ACJA0U_001210 [Salibacteraceae bacterium]|jgi:hypothetical protein
MVAQMKLTSYQLGIRSLLPLFALLLMYSTYAQVSKVEVVKNDGAWSLTVDGKPFYINGAGGIHHLDILVKAGGNTIRTWGTENGLQILDDAHAKGLKVMMGLWVQHERHGFDYNNEAAVKAQLENFRKDIKRFKDHPALLVWGIGNEYELNYSNTKVWSAVNDIAKMVHEEDPNHPTSTVTAGTNAEKLKFVMDELPEIDIYGINTYAGINVVKDVIEDGGFSGPYMITEWGPTGHWECTKTMWNSSVEQSSTEKSASYLERFTKYIGSQKEQCIGSFCFLWGQKQEYTSTWYGLFSEDGMPTAALDELQYCWSGSYPENRAPAIDSVLFNGNAQLLNIITDAGSKNEVTVFVGDKDNDKLNYSWELYPESTDLKTGGDSEGKPPLITGKVTNGKSPSIKLKSPLTEGRYRLFVFIDDDQKMAYMNIPFYVQNSPELENSRIRLKTQELEQLDEY